MAATRKRKPAQSRATFAPWLTVKQTRALRAILAGSTDAKAAQSAGVNAGTISCWRHNDPVFSGTLKRFQNEMLREAAAALRDEATASIRFLAKVRDDENEPTSARVRAANGLLKLAKIHEPAREPEGFTEDEFLALGVLDNRAISDADDDRAAHELEITEGFKKSKIGRRLDKLRGDADELDREIGNLRPRHDRLRPFAERVPRTKRKDSEEVRIYEEVATKYYDALGRQRKVQAELEQLEKFEKRMRASLVRDPNDLAEDARSVIKLVRRIGKDRVASLMHKYGQVEGIAQHLLKADDAIQIEELGIEREEEDRRNNPTIPPD